MAESSSNTALIARRPGESWSLTGGNDTKVSHRWTINNFTMLLQHNKTLNSLSFTGGGPAEWHLQVQTRGYTQPQTGAMYVGLSLHLDTPANAPLIAQCKFSILNNIGERRNENTGHFDSVQKKTCVWSTTTFIPYSELQKTQSEFLVGDRLTILCELCIKLSPLDASTLLSPPIAKPSSNLIADLGSLLEGGQHSDVTLVAEGKAFQAHMCILSARSPVFKAMFQHDMRESKEKKVDISDLSADTVQEMLQHIYTGDSEVSTLEQSAESLLEAADKYDLPSLKSACEETLCSKLEVKNAARLLMLADKHHADQLKADCVHVIAAHPKEVQESEGWNDMKEQPVSLSLKQLTKIQSV